MNIFRLPDLGEGLPDAEIREWYVKEGETVKTDQPIAAMETAKALVDVPAPFDGVIEKLYGEPGDTIQTGEPLIGFEGAGAHEEPVREDSGTVVGSIEVSDEIVADDTFGGVATTEHAASPAVRALARRRGVELGLLATQDGRIHASHVKKISKTTPVEAPTDFQTMSAVRRAMILSMNKSHQEVVPVTLTDDADIQSWYGTDNITMRIIRAIAAGCKAEPMLNSHFNGKHMAFKLNEEVNIGLAVDTPHGLYVPVLKNVAQTSDEDLRATINRFKEQSQTKSIPQSDLHGGTIMLSNFGTIAGRYANPILLPPMTAIIGVGKLRDEVVAVDGAPAVHKIIPLSVTVDHRAITGGEAARFLKTLIDNLR
jgi:2-oxoisovalerate dehydrogenase E2 component (dihydrolipoyl transacylase)